VQSSNIIRTIASEGRKFGLGLCVVSQRPAMVDKNVLSQCNTQIILKVTNPNDLKAIIASVEGLTTATVDEIQRLPVSVAIVIGGSIQVPIFVDVRVRETKHGGRPVDIFSNVETYHGDQKMEEETVFHDSPFEHDEQLDIGIPPALHSNTMDSLDSDEEINEPDIVRKEVIPEDNDMLEEEQYSASERFADLKNKNKYLKSIFTKSERASVSRSALKDDSDTTEADQLPELKNMKDIIDSESYKTQARRRKNG
jgi:hypothetical protein